jgi:tetratricopeptide (TPR) repeat protein
VNVPSVLASQDLIDGLTPSNSPDARLASFQSSISHHGLGHQEIAEQLVSVAAQEANDQNASQQTRQGLVDLAGSEMNAELVRAPNDARLRLQFALFLRSISDLKDAQLQSAAARADSPNKQIIILEQGIEAFQAGQYPAAKDFFMQAYKLNMDYKDPLISIAATDIASGDVVGGKALLQQTYGTTAVPSQMLILAYYQIKDWNDLIEIIKAQIANSDDVNTEFQLVAAYYQAGRKDDAITQLHAIEQAHPEAQQEAQALLQQLGAK